MDSQQQLERSNNNKQGQKTGLSNMRSHPKFLQRDTSVLSSMQLSTRQQPHDHISVMDIQAVQANQEPTILKSDKLSTPQMDKVHKKLMAAMSRRISNASNNNSKDRYMGARNLRADRNATSKSQMLMIDSRPPQGRTAFLNSQNKALQDQVPSSSNDLAYQERQTLSKNTQQHHLTLKDKETKSCNYQKLSEKEGNKLCFQSEQWNQQEPLQGDKQLFVKDVCLNLCQRGSVVQTQANHQLTTSPLNLTQTRLSPNPFTQYVQSTSKQQQQFKEQQIRGFLASNSHSRNNGRMMSEISSLALQQESEQQRQTDSPRIEQKYKECFVFNNTKEKTNQNKHQFSHKYKPSREYSQSYLNQTHYPVKNDRPLLADNLPQKQQRQITRQFSPLQRLDHEEQNQKMGLYEQLFQSSCQQEKQKMLEKGLEFSENEAGFFFLHKKTQKALEKQLGQLHKFTVDFAITKRLISETFCQYLNSNQQKSYVQSQQFNAAKDAPQRSKDFTHSTTWKGENENQEQQCDKWTLYQKQKQFETQKLSLEGITHSLQSYAKDVIKGSSSNMNQEESLKRRIGLVDYLSELNDCQKSLLRLMRKISPENCFPMYIVDFIWKMTLLRVEYILHDEEERNKKFERQLQLEKKKEVAEMQHSWSLKETDYLDQIKKLKQTKEYLISRNDRLAEEKLAYGDTLREKEEEIARLTSPHGLEVLGALNMELDGYIGDMSNMSEQNGEALKGLQQFFNRIQLTKNKQVKDNEDISSPPMKKEIASSSDEGTPLLRLKQISNAQEDIDHFYDTNFDLSVSQGSPIKRQFLQQQQELKSQDDGMISPQLSQKTNKKRHSQMKKLKTVTSIRITRTQDQQVQTYNQEDQEQSVCIKCLKHINSDSPLDSISLPFPTFTNTQVKSPIEGDCTDKNASFCQQSSPLVSTINYNPFGNASKQAQLLNQINPQTKDIVVMTESSLLKHIEDILDAKYEADQRIFNLIQSRQKQNQTDIQYEEYQDMLTFTHDYFISRHGLKTIAVRYLNSILIGLLKQYNKSQQSYQYAIFLIQIFGLQPEQYTCLRSDQVRLALKAKQLFKIVQSKQNYGSQKATLDTTMLVHGGTLHLNAMIPYLFSGCNNQAKGLFSGFINNLQYSDVYQDQSIVTQKTFINFKMLTLIRYSRIDLTLISMRTPERELQMNVVLQHIEEMLDIKISITEITIFKKEFENFYLVPLQTLESKLSGAISLMGDLQITLLTFTNKLLLEWECHCNSQRKKLLKTFIDFDDNLDGVLTLDEFKEIIKSFESNVSADRVIRLFNEALDISNHENQKLSDKMTPKAFVEMALRNRLGGYGFEYLAVPLQKQEEQSNQSKIHDKR